MLNPPLATAEMLQIAEVSEGDNVLLIGAGTGYLAALLSDRVKKLVAVESDAELAKAARANVAGLDVIEGVLSQGSKKAAPYSLIIIDGATTRGTRHHLAARCGTTPPTAHPARTGTAAGTPAWR